MVTRDGSASAPSRFIASGRSAVSARRAQLARRIPGAEFVSTASAVALFVAMFWTEWFGVNTPPGKADGAERATAENAWHGLTVLRWLMLVTIIVAIGGVLLHLTQRMHGASTETNGPLAILGTITALLVSYRVFVDLPQSASVVDQKLGACAGVLCAFGIPLGAYHSLRLSRARERAAQPRPRPRRATERPSGQAAGAPPRAPER
jgi:hypothetical protein